MSRVFGFFLILLFFVSKFFAKNASRFVQALSFDISLAIRFMHYRVFVGALLGVTCTSRVTCRGDVLIRIRT